MVEKLDKYEIIATKMGETAISLERAKVIEDGNNGYLFKVGNENKLAEKILRGLKNSEENKKIRKNARKAVEKFSWNKLIDEIDEILKSLI